MNIPTNFRHYRKLLYVSSLILALVVVTSTILSKNVKRPAEQGTFEVTDERSPEVPKGGVYKDDSGVFHFPQEVINIDNGVFLEHKVPNGNMAIYKNGSENWTFKKGETVYLNFSVEDVEECEYGFRSAIGYIKGNVFNDFCIKTLWGNSTVEFNAVEFNAPEDGEYSFYLLNISADPIYIKSLSMETN